ncbi:hypothetical protein D0Z07_8945 [Hyphodiscus hymeniophilus]|uniref:Uncharacterized protein n=1 Tax=Hyphodiscus hymeniophilus TaxID=353542 RepID=A0A9P6SMQ3_9HELO|nr:hypothetical protein D0Z07_8945 [Hyphodiscus hymeniophilus]
MTSPVPQIIRPKPRRPFQTSSPQPPSPLLSSTLPDETPSRTHSILNLTSSTLLGIYSHTGYQSDREELSTPWGTGAETPSLSYNSNSPSSPSSSRIYRRKATAPPPPAPSTSSTVLSLLSRSVLLCGIGMLYGLLVRHLHDDRQLAAFQVEGIIKPRNGWAYLVFWGVSGVALGSLLPWVDGLWEQKFENLGKEKRERSSTPEAEEDELDSSGIFGADWTPVIRSVGAFVGIAFAIRKLPWTSTLQASLTLFLVNPVLWYIIDRSKPGFLLSSSVGAIGTTLLLASNPDMMPSPTASLHINSTVGHNNIIRDDMGGLGNYVSRESIEGGIWILSVLFCSCVCFGNVGRRLALSGGPAAREQERERNLAAAARAFKADNGPGKSTMWH